MYDVFYFIFLDSNYFKNLQLQYVYTVYSKKFLYFALDSPNQGLVQHQSPCPISKRAVRNLAFPTWEVPKTTGQSIPLFRDFTFTCVKTSFYAIPQLFIPQQKNSSQLQGFHQDLPFQSLYIFECTWTPQTFPDLKLLKKIKKVVYKYVGCLQKVGIPQGANRRTFTYT